MAIKIDPQKATASGVHALKRAQVDSSQEVPAQAFKISQNKESQQASTSPLQNSQPMGGVEGIFFAVMNPDESGKQNLTFGHDLLDQLNQLSIHISLGLFDKETLLKIEESSKRDLSHACDPRLHEILKEIQTLAAVQLAKLDK